MLISPISVRDVDWVDEVANVKLSQQQVRDSPSVDTDKPVSRQHEIDYYNYYGYSNYWEGANLWGLGVYPVPWVGASSDVALSPRQPQDDALARQRQRRLDREREAADSHLRSSKEVIGYEIMATDGPIGSVEDFVFDDESWAIRYMVVDTRKWLPGKHVLLSPEWIDSVSWSEHEVYVKVARQAIETSPEYRWFASALQGARSDPLRASWAYRVLAVTCGIDRRRTAKPERQDRPRRDAQGYGAEKVGS